MIRRILVTVALAVVFASCASKPDLDESQTPRSRYGALSGESAVGVIPEGVLRDETRHKDVPITVEYPTRPGPHPLIIFSHGYGSSNRAYAGLSSYWASQGYVVVKPGHADANRMPDQRNVQDIWQNQTAADWRERVRDVTFIIDSLDMLEKSYPELQGKIDHTKIGVGGHSYGAYTAMLVGGVRTYPGAVSYADPRVTAVMAMSPQGPGEVRGLTRDSWTELHKPAMFMTGSEDRGVTEEETPEWRRQAFELSPAGDKVLVVVAGARHGSYTGRLDAPLISPYDTRQQPAIINDPVNDPRRDPNRDPYYPDQTDRRPREAAAGMRQRGVFSTIKAVSLMFWDTYLQGTAEGREALDKAGERFGVELVKK